MSEFSRIMSPGGSLILIDLISHNDETMREKYADLWLGFNPDEIGRWLKKSGFDIAKMNVEKSEDPDLGVFMILAEKKRKPS